MTAKIDKKGLNSSLLKPVQLQRLPDASVPSGYETMLYAFDCSSANCCGCRAHHPISCPPLRTSVSYSVKNHQMLTSAGIRNRERWSEGDGMIFDRTKLRIAKSYRYLYISTSGSNEGMFMTHIHVRLLSTASPAIHVDGNCCPRSFMELPDFSKIVLSTAFCISWQAAHGKFGSLQRNQWDFLNFKTLISL